MASKSIDTRFDRLTHGINTAHWFAQAPLTAENFRTRITNNDLQLIHDLGFRHVRLPLDPDVLFDLEHPATLSQNLEYLDAAIDLILTYNLAVIIDLHPTSDFKQQLYTNPDFAEAVGEFWFTLAEHLSRFSPEYVFLEVMNEPATEDPQTWYAIQAKLLAEMRRGAPEHTLIASANMRVGETWSDIEGLKALAPIADTNIVYNFHFYKPMSFTHQGAEWGEQAWQHLHNVPYPSNEAIVASVLPTIADETARQWLQHYGEEQWNAEKIAAWIAQAGTWGRSHQVRVTCNEFGVYRKVADPESRSAWIRDVRTSLEANQIGWAMWEYDAGFGLVQQTDAVRTPRPEIVNALFTS
ncbi:MAG: glycoside hydrolase family 5 protein [Elainellaceae cyanobacterium]